VPGKKVLFYDDDYALDTDADDDDNFYDR